MDDSFEEELQQHETNRLLSKIPRKPVTFIEYMMIEETKP